MIRFNDTQNYTGLVQFYERELGFERGHIAGNTTRLKEFTAETRLAFDNFLTLALPASGKWQLDDTNHADYPIIKTNLVSGQRDYTFTTDEQGNLILDVYRVAILPSATETEYQEIFPVDVQSDNDSLSILQENTDGGAPYWYDKTANGLFLDPIPNYNATLGLKVYINREASYFTYTDTTKYPGVPGLFHAYFYLYPALEYARRKSLKNENSLARRVAMMEAQIIDYFGKRDRDDRDIISPEPINYL